MTCPLFTTNPLKQTLKSLIKNILWSFGYDVIGFCCCT